MSVPWKQVLLDELVQRQVLQPDAQARLQFEEDAPWYVMILSAIAAWFAAMMLLGAWTIMTDASPLPSMLAAAILLLSAIWLLRGSGAFVMQLGLALSLLGQAMLVFAIIELGPHTGANERSAAVAALLLSCGMLMAIAGAAHRFFCALIALVSLAVLVGNNPLLSLYGVALAAVAVCLWLARACWAASRRAALIRAVAGASTLVALVLGVIGQPYAHVASWLSTVATDAGRLVWLYPAGAAIVLLATLVRLLRDVQLAVRVAALAGALVLIALCIQAPGLLIGAALWLAVFHACDRLWCVLVGMGVVLYLGDLYYSLHITLLAKSVLLAASGLLLLVLRAAVIAPLRRAS
ncbi:protein of unknown function [Halopseudomonas litoralis]|uniref:DUF4401 domain-containing protein n=1 Tax=Halopseudomonas litoralis TaxID=797277 RepID=A0A1H1STR7_9GAMM|nr:DUF4401 domain-containing protein [Halopseudomonas litoralis]SDS50779.1 protein of unknown function [Halopseudomonas litoralis]